ncbi:MAG: Cof-type HAD-IIB family hydrolase [Lachnospiraceae bacterium]|nr:Cof-type HAD-IIB family hydrolase [Lachnospiraceae bacterium]
MNRKAVFFDIDGTLLVLGKPVLQSTIDAIRKIRENGHLAFICTGRSRVMVPQTPILDIGFDGIVGACGMYGEFQGKEVFRYSLSGKQLEEMISLFRKYGIMYILEGTEYIYYDEETVDDIADDWYLQYVNETIPQRFLPVQKVKTIEACKASIHARTSDPGELYKSLSRNYEVMEHVFGVAEFVPKGFSKAKGISLMCERLGIDVADTIAVGDSINDVDMLKHAGIGICMGNGSEPAKECADYITTDIFEDGIYHAMEHFGLL